MYICLHQPVIRQIWILPGSDLCEEGYVEALTDWIWLAADRETQAVLSLKGLVGKALFTPVIAEVKWLCHAPLSGDIGGGWGTRPWQRSDETEAGLAVSDGRKVKSRMGSGESKPTVLECMIKNFTKGFGGGCSIKLTPDKLRTFCETDWRSFGVGRLSEGALVLD